MIEWVGWTHTLEQKKQIAPRFFGDFGAVEGRSGRHSLGDYDKRLGSVFYCLDMVRRVVRSLFGDACVVGVGCTCAEASCPGGLGGVWLGILEHV